MLKHEVFINGALLENCYVVWDDADKEGIIVDPGYAEVSVIDEFLKKENIKITAVVNTHGHWDHVYGNADMMALTQAPLLIHEADITYLTDPVYNLSHNYSNDFSSPPADKTFVEGDVIKVGAYELKILHTPGHTPGSVVLFNAIIVLTGDTLFFGSVGRSDFLGGSKEGMVTSLEKLKKEIPESAVVLSGHGKVQTTFGEQLEMNPFLTGQMQPK